MIRSGSLCLDAINMRTVLVQVHDGDIFSFLLKRHEGAIVLCAVNANTKIICSNIHEPGLESTQFKSSQERVNARHSLLGRLDFIFKFSQVLHRLLYH